MQVRLSTRSPDRSFEKSPHALAEAPEAGGHTGSETDEPRQPERVGGIGWRPRSLSLSLSLSSPPTTLSLASL